MQGNGALCLGDVRPCHNVLDWRCCPGVNPVFTPLPHDHRKTGPLLVSFVVHGLALYLLLRPPVPIFVAQTSVAWGQHGTSTTLVYLAQHGNAPATSAGKTERILLSAPAPKPRRQRQAAASALKKKATAEAAALPPRAGSPFGSLLEGPIEGHDVRPAYPVVFPDPVVRRSEIPPGVEGNVIVEITIDAQGIVTDMKVLQALGYGIEDKVLAALRNWRFKPATVDGVAMASKQDVHFRFPS